MSKKVCVLTPIDGGEDLYNKIKDACNKLINAGKDVEWNSYIVMHLTVPELLQFTFQQKLMHIELLSGIPSIIYGLFGLGVLTKLVEGLGSIFGIQTAGGISLLATVLVLSIMILPTITTIAITSISSVNNSLILGSLALGASPTQTNFKVVLIGAKSGIFSGIILGIGRALGEATAITMVCGNSGSGISFNPFDITRTLTSTMLQGIHESSGMDYDIRFSIGLLLCTSFS